MPYNINGFGTTFYGERNRQDIVAVVKTNASLGAAAKCSIDELAVSKLNRITRGPSARRENGER